MLDNIYAETEVGSSTPTTNKSHKIAKMWAKYDNAFVPCELAVETLDPGQYTIAVKDQQPVFVQKTINLDSLIEFPDSKMDKILSEMELFWNKEQTYRDFGFLWKRGILLWGPPGSGKTTTVQMLSKMIIERGGLSVYIDNPRIGAYGLELLRRIEPSRPVVVILEDIDAIISKYDESDLLSLLDGELQIDNVIFIATTNYPQKLDGRIVNRPSRFDLVEKIDTPSPEARRIYLINKKPSLEKELIEVDDPDVMKRIIENRKLLEEYEADDGITKARITKLKREISKDEKVSKKKVNALDHWVESTDGFTFAHLKELFLKVEVLGQNFMESEAAVRSLFKRPNSNESSVRAGF